MSNETLTRTYVEGDIVLIPEQEMDGLLPGKIVPGRYAITHVHYNGAELGIHVQVVGGGGPDNSWDYADRHPSEVTVEIVYFEVDEVRRWNDEQ